MLEIVIQRAIGTPWAITPEYGAIVQDILVSRAHGVRLTDAEIQQRIEQQRSAQPKRASMFDDDDDEPHDPTQYATIPMSASTGGTRGADGVIAVIPIYGVICNRSFDASSGMTSADFVAAMFNRAESDPSVKAILFDVASPGGSVEGVPELGKLIASGGKARVAFVNALSASAAYWLSSQCHEIVARESAAVGSVGVYALTEDWSKYLDKEGIKINAISAGDYKLEGAPWEPLSDDARAFIQESVNATYQKFLAAVAKGRGTTVADVKKNFGQGRCFESAQALAAGMVDKIGELDVAIARCDALARSVSKAAQHTSAPVVAALKPERFMGDPQGQEDADVEHVSPNADGGCPDGYEKHDDGLCYVKQDDPNAEIATDVNQAQADRDAIELARA